MELDEVSVNTDGGGAGGETQDEGLGSSGSELLDALLDVLGCSCIISFGENKKKSVLVKRSKHGGRYHIIYVFAIFVG